ncbi:MAG: glycosyltransferase [Candidatus Sericytochromatia bacterium]
MKPSLSILVNTAAGREDNLIHCLEQLTRQSDPDFEVIVNDCGSEGGAARVAPFAERLRLRYDWRPFDLCVSRSRNRGAKMADGDYLILIDGDMLLHPGAVAAYRVHAQRPACAILGYYGNAPFRKAPSLWQPDRQVNYLDTRVALYSRHKITPYARMLQFPHEYGWSANFGVSRADYWAVGGFDERFQGWGGEDPQFALDLAMSGCALDYAFDVWAEHQVHSRFTPFHHHTLAGKAFVKMQYVPQERPMAILGKGPLLTALIRHLFQHYFPNDSNWGEEYRHLMAYPQARYQFRENRWQVSA